MAAARAPRSRRPATPCSRRALAPWFTHHASRRERRWSARRVYATRKHFHRRLPDDRAGLEREHRQQLDLRRVGDLHGHHQRHRHRHRHADGQRRVLRRIDRPRAGNSPQRQRNQRNLDIYHLDLGGGRSSSISAVYTPTGNSVGSSGSLSLTVNPAALTITANSTSKTYGQTASFAGTAFTKPAWSTATRSPA